MTSNGTEKQPPVFLLHPIEGVVNALETLAKQVQAPVYGLQCTANSPLSSINELSKHYLSEVKKVQPKGPYTFVGYSFGACVAFEMGVQAEASGERVTLLLLDGSPSYVATHTGKARQTKITKGNTAAEESEALAFFAMQFKDVDLASVSTLIHVTLSICNYFFMSTKRSKCWYKKTGALQICIIIKIIRYTKVTFSPAIRPFFCFFF